MRKLDRAVYAIFLLVLLADVARAHASVPAGGDGGSILSAASQLQVSEAGDAILVFRRTDGASAQVARFNCSSLTFSGWAGVEDGRSRTGQSKAGQSHSLRSLDSFPSHALISVAPGLTAAVGGARPLDFFEPDFVALAIFEHSGSPAP